jgi:hypothetical protein
MSGAVSLSASSGKERTPSLRARVAGGRNSAILLLRRGRTHFHPHLNEPRLDHADLLRGCMGKIDDPVPTREAVIDANLDRLEPSPFARTTFARGGKLPIT